MAMAARCFNSPMVLVKQDTPKKLPIYLPMPSKGMILRMADLMVSFGNDSFGKGFNELMLRNFKALTLKYRYKMVNSFVDFVACVRVMDSGLCKNSTIVTEAISHSSQQVKQSKRRN